MVTFGFRLYQAALIYTISIYIYIYIYINSSFQYVNSGEENFLKFFHHVFYNVMKFSVEGLILSKSIGDLSTSFKMLKANSVMN